MTTTQHYVGRTTWVIADGYIPAESHGPAPAMTSHESLAMLNTGDAPAHVEITVYFKDREPAGPYRVTVDPRRTLHLRFNSLNDPEVIPRETDYSAVVKSDVPIVAQQTRLDSRQRENALLSTVPWSE